MSKAVFETYLRVKQHFAPGNKSLVFVQHESPIMSENRYLSTIGASSRFMAEKVNEKFRSKIACFHAISSVVFDDQAAWLGDVVDDSKMAVINNRRRFLSNPSETLAKDCETIASSITPETTLNSLIRAARKNNNVCNESLSFLVYAMFPLDTIPTQERNHQIATLHHKNVELLYTVVRGLKDVLSQERTLKAWNDALEHRSILLADPESEYYSTLSNKHPTENENDCINPRSKEAWQSTGISSRESEGNQPSWW